MNVALTNYGLRFTAEQWRAAKWNKPGSDAECLLLLDLWTGILAPYQDQPAYNRLLAHGLIERIPETLSKEEVALRYRRYPLEHVEKVIFEYTTCCNFNCRHCYNAGVERATENDVEVLKSAADVFVRMGVRRFDFVGGEVSRYGDGWLGLVRHIRQYSNTTVMLYTNGWWLGQSGFVAAGQRYTSTAAYLAHLQQSGLSHIAFSLDGQGAEHDRSRRQPGLYSRILEGFDVVRAAGLEPRLSLLVRDMPDKGEFIAFLAELAGRIYPFPAGTQPAAKALALIDDGTNTLSNFVDAGSGARAETGRFDLCTVPDAKVSCKNFFRPAPSLTIKANGELATCRVANAGEGYGNLHKQDLVQILNGLQDQFVFKLHAERRLGEYRRFVHTDIFGSSFAHLCTLRAILTLIARRMEEEGVKPEDKGAVLRINQEVARYTGHLSSCGDRTFGCATIFRETA